MEPAINTEEALRFAEATSFALPMSKDTPYRTPSGSRSRNGSMTPDQSSSPPLPPTDDATSRSRSGTSDMAMNGGISPLDPRRFTPTLHANLVGEILSLRRELENKNKDISHLEDTVHRTRSENEGLTASLAGTNKDARTLRKQMELLEGGTLSALDELAKERDDALDNLSEARKRLEQTQRKARAHEEEAERTHRLYQSDKITWESDRRALETKVHIVEGRLKVVVSELAASGQSHEQEQSTGGSPSKAPIGEHTVRSESAASVRSTHVPGRRRGSSASSAAHDLDHLYHRHSVAINTVNGRAGMPSLADELGFDEEDEDNLDENGEHFDSMSPEALPDERPRSGMRDRLMDLKARKVLGLAIESGIVPEDDEDFHRLSLLAEDPDEEVAEQTSTLVSDYVDVAVQYSPPPSPRLLSDSGKKDFVREDNAASLSAGDIMANQGRKRVSNSPLRDKTSVDSFRDTSSNLTRMTSTSSQTIGDLPSPPSTPKISDGAEPTSEAVTTSHIEVTSRETQTDSTDLFEQSQPLVPVRLIPKIAIHPPASRPSTPRDSVVLPPHTKNAGCQVDLRNADTRSVGMQTEEIRVDKRPVKLPPHLISATPSAARSVEKPQVDKSFIRGPPRRKYRSPPPVAPSNQPSMYAEPVPPVVPADIPDNDTGRLTKSSRQEINRPVRSSSLFAGFHDDADEADGQEKEEMFDDDDFFTRPMKTYTLKAGKVVSKTPISGDDLVLKSDQLPASPSEALPQAETRVPVERVMDDVPEAVESEQEGEEAPLSDVPFQKRPAPLRPATLPKSTSIRRTALISSGAAAHQAGRARSPSLPAANAPPFPVPTRHSSRKIGLSSSEGARSSTPNSMDRLSYDEEPVLRKSLSAAAMAHPELQRSQSPPLLSASTIPESPSLPPMPSDQVSPFGAYTTFGSPNPNQVPARREHARSESSSTAVAQTTVVDAIAQTMIGEWMWKYVRRGKGFGPSEASHPDWDTNGKSGEGMSANITSNGNRHRRWVWLAPYEGAVMWSSKQPTSGPALLGKSGRKLSIQSVLDVKDDTPMSRSSGNHFNRSILILTPQRALKFTAFSKDRHYVWLSALSFLSHSPNGVGDLGAVPGTPLDDSAPPPVPSRSSRRPTIRDSIRVAKGKGRGGIGMNGGMRSFTTDGNIPRLNQARQPDTNTDYSYDYEPEDAAEPPVVARTTMHSRKRSNTAPRPPPTSFRSYPSTINNYPPSSKHSGSAGSSLEQPRLFSNTTGYHSMTIGGGSIGVQSDRSSMSRGTSLSSGQMPPSGQTVNSYFDNLGTVRMEAFINRGLQTAPQSQPQPQDVHVQNNSRTGTGFTRSSYRTRPGRKKDMSYWGATGGTPGSLGAVNNNDSSHASSDSWTMRGEDPFRGF